MRRAIFVMGFLSFLAYFLVFPAPYFAVELNPIEALCSDYEMLIVNTQQCVSRCPMVCSNGICFEDGPCPCDDFYQSSPKGLTCAMDCLPGCKSAGGYCVGPDLCLCRKGFYFNKIARQCWKRTLLQDRCFGRCLYGTCTSTGECICAQGFERAILNGTTRIRHLLGQYCIPTCKQNCGPLGFCFMPNMCACRKKHFHYESDGKCHKDVIYLG